MFNYLQKEEKLKRFVLLDIQQLVCCHHKDFYELCTLESNNGNRSNPNSAKLINLVIFHKIRNFLLYTYLFILK